MVLILLCHWEVWRWTRDRMPQLVWLLGASALFGAAGMFFELPWAWRYVPPGEWFFWARGAAIAWGICSCGTTLIWALGRRMTPRFDPGRRQLVLTARAVAAAAPAAVTGFGILVGRRDLQAVEVEMRVPGLPKDLDGVRIAQLSDIHYGPFLSRRELAQAVGMANDFRPHLTVVTGDLITRNGDPIEECLRELAALRASSGVWGCMGNHEIYANCEAYVQREGRRRDLHFLRGQKQELRFGEARLNLAGVDYQKMHGDYLRGAEALREAGAWNVLLSHNPDAFRTAAEQGWDLMLAGHTHGGQVTVEYLHQHLNFARFFTPYVYGRYEEGGSQLYVTRGIGTVGIPARIGAPPEVALIKLCATS
ncbi:MAG: metallophosphoesterase [Acidobacteriota bacterium]|jgi:hypothetical protein